LSIKLISRVDGQKNVAHPHLAGRVIQPALNVCLGGAGYSTRSERFALSFRMAETFRSIRPFIVRLLASGFLWFEFMNVTPGYFGFWWAFIYHPTRFLM